MINTITIEGRITKDIEIKQFNDTKVINNSIVVYGGKDKEEQEITYFFDFKAFNYLAERLSKYSQKGSKIVLKGLLAQDKWEKDGNTIYKTVIYADDIVICDAKKVDNKEEKPREEDLPW